MAKFTMTYNRWMLLIGAVGTVVVPWLVASYVSRTQIDLQKRQDAVAAGQSLVQDLEAIKGRTPEDPELSKCLEERRGQDFWSSMEICVQNLHRNQENARDLLERNKLSLRLLLDESAFNTILDRVQVIDFVLYEMNNNQAMMEYRKAENCPEGKFSKDLPDTTNYPRDKEGNIKCLFVILDYEYALENGIEYWDKSKVLESLRVTKSGTVLSQPDISKGTTSEFFRNAQAFLYQVMLNQIDLVVSDLRIVVIE